MYNWPSTVATTLKAGCTIPEAVSAGLLDESDVDPALRRTLGLRFRLGLFDPIDDQPYWCVPSEDVGSDAH